MFFFIYFFLLRTGELHFPLLSWLLAFGSPTHTATIVAVILLFCAAQPHFSTTAPFRETDTHTIKPLQFLPLLFVFLISFFLSFFLGYFPKRHVDVSIAAQSKSYLSSLQFSFHLVLFLPYYFISPISLSFSLQISLDVLISNTK